MLLFFWLITLIQPSEGQTRSVFLSQAISRAAGGISDDLPVPLPPRYDRSRHPEHDNVAAAYLAALRRGHPILLSRSPQTEAVTKQIVLGLNRGFCEEWLRSSMEMVMDDAARRRTLDALGGAAVMQKKDVAIAVWNLSSDVNLRADAKNLWDTIELSNLAMYETEQSREKNSTTHVPVRQAGRYRPAPMPAWQLRPEQRCADRTP